MGLTYFGVHSPQPDLTISVSCRLTTGSLELNPKHPATDAKTEGLALHERTAAFGVVVKNPAREFAFYDGLHIHVNSAGLSLYGICTARGGCAPRTGCHFKRDSRAGAGGNLHNRTTPHPTVDPYSL